MATDERKEALVLIKEFIDEHALRNESDVWKLSERRCKEVLSALCQSYGYCDAARISAKQITQRLYVAGLGGSPDTMEAMIEGIIRENFEGKL